MLRGAVAFAWLGGVPFQAIAAHRARLRVFEIDDELAQLSLEQHTLPPRWPPGVDNEIAADLAAERHQLEKDMPANDG